MNKPDSHGGGLDWTKICEKSSKVITFIDLAGHEKYLKTTVFGMTGHLPDFCMLMVREGKEKSVYFFCCLGGLLKYTFCLSLPPVLLSPLRLAATLALLA